jgi:hypothetical protein
MENVQTAIQHAYDAKPSEFKSAILDALNDKIADHVSARKMELAGSIFKDEDEEQQSNDSETEFQSSSEGNVDEDL